MLDCRVFKNVTNIKAPPLVEIGDTRPGAEQNPAPANGLLCMYQMRHAFGDLSILSQDTERRGENSGINLLMDGI